MDKQFWSHPLKWSSLKEAVERSHLEDPDIWIEDLRRYGPCQIDGKPIDAEVISEDTDIVEASFSIITDIANNRIIIRHHY